MTARALVQFINRPTSELPNLKSQVLKRLLHVVLIGEAKCGLLPVIDLRGIRLSM
jgi:hypothetical protein